LLGEVLAFTTFFLSRLVAHDDVLRLVTADNWRMVAGHGVVYGIAAVIGVGVGALVRQTAGAISLLLVWTLLVENLVQLIPNVGQDISRWLPFNNATLFAANREVVGVVDPLSVTASLGVFAGAALLIMIAATVVVRRRDA
jgi:ABC-2 type transport system permease protein